MPHRYATNRFAPQPLPEEWHVPLGDPEAFHKTLPGYAPTPLVSLGSLGRELGIGGLFLKDESHRFGLNAFKALGASWAINEIVRRTPGKSYTFATATDGNHGRAVAWSARRLGHKAIIYVPSNTAAVRIERIREEGAECIVVDGTYDETVRRSAKDAEAFGYHVVSDTAYPGYMEIPRWIMEGYRTLFTEAMRQFDVAGEKEPTHVILQSGVGGLACAGAIFFRRRSEAYPTLVSVEPTDADCLLESILDPEGAIRECKGKQNSVMAGLNCGTPSLLAWPVIRASFRAFLAVDDDCAEDATRRRASERIISGESGAAPRGIQTWRPFAVSWGAMPAT